MLPGKRTEPQELRDTFHAPLVGGRWLLVGAETIETAVLMAMHAVSSAGVQVLFVLFLYNLGSLVLVHLLPIRKVPIVSLLILDLVFVALVSVDTGGTASPFLGQCYLIIFAGALFYGIRGGLAVGVGSALAVVLTAYRVPGSGGMAAMRQMVPYFLVAGGFTGYLVARLRAAYEAQRAVLIQEQAQAVLVEVDRREMLLARSMQEAALPSEPPRLPGLDIAVRTQIAREVGGDFYLFVTDRTQAGLVVGDVSGKGIPAAFVAVTIGHLLPWMCPLDDPCTCLRDLNQDLLERLPDAAFATLIMAEVEYPAGHVTLWNAGHPSAMLWEAETRRVRTFEERGPLLGIYREWDCPPVIAPLEPGDALLLYTDGMFEVRNEAGELYGQDRLAECVARHGSLPAEQLAEALVKEVEAWGPPGDDVTLLVCKRTATEPAK